MQLERFTRPVGAQNAQGVRGIGGHTTVDVQDDIAFLELQIGVFGWMHHQKPFLRAEILAEARSQRQEFGGPQAAHLEAIAKAFELLEDEVVLQLAAQIRHLGHGAFT